MELQTIVKMFSEGSYAVGFFVILWLILKQFTKALDKIYQMLEADLKYKELLTGILSRLETKLDIALNNIDKQKGKQ